MLKRSYAGHPCSRPVVHLRMPRRPPSCCRRIVDAAFCTLWLGWGPGFEILEEKHSVARKSAGKPGPIKDRLHPCMEHAPPNMQAASRRTVMVSLLGTSWFFSRWFRKIAALGAGLKRFFAEFRPIYRLFTDRLRAMAIDGMRSCIWGDGRRNVIRSRGHQGGPGKLLAEIKL